MTSSNMRVGIIGCGWAGESHLKGYRENGIEPVAFSDSNRLAAEALSRNNGGGEVFEDFRELIASGTVDAISICLPPAYHEEAAVLALQNKVHVLCEKPLAHSVMSGRVMVEAQKESQALLMTGFCHRFRPAILKLRELIRAGRIGPVVFFINAFGGPAESMKDKWFSKKALSGGGSMLDAGSHSVDLFRFLVGEIVEQMALTRRHMPEIDVEDAAVLSVKSDEGTLGVLMSSWVVGASLFYIDVIGRTGRLFYDYGNEIRLTRPNRDEERIPVPVSSGFTEEVAHFLSAIKKEINLSCTGEDGLKALDVIFECYSTEAKRLD